MEIFAMILVSLRMYTKIFVLKIFVKGSVTLERYFENSNVRKFCNDSRIVENVYKMFILKIFGVFGKMFVFESVMCENGFSF